MTHAFIQQNKLSNFLSLGDFIMRNNKILAAAIASALSLGAGSAFAAASLELRQPGIFENAGVGDDTDATVPYPAGKTVTFASELFTSATTSVPREVGQAAVAYFSDDSFIVAFNLGVGTGTTRGPVTGGNAVSVKATLSQGTWAGGILPLEQVVLCATNALVPLAGLAPLPAAPGACLGGDGPTATTISKGSLTSSDTDSVADFFIQVAAAETLETTATLFFSFAIDDLQALQNNGSVTLTMESFVIASGATLPAGTPAPITLANSLPGLSTDFLTPETVPSKVYIDVDQALKGFVEGGSTPTQVVSLGTLKISDASSNPLPRDVDGSTQFTFDPTGTGVTASGKLQIQSGIFSASMTGNATGKVFLDDGDGIYSETADILADQVDKTNASWNFDATDLKKIYDVGGGMKILVLVDGVAEIEEQPVAPTGTFSMKYNSDTERTYPPRKLRHIKRNGSKCTLYNIPDGRVPNPDGGNISLDKVTVRIHNRSNTKTGTLRGTLIDQTGKVLFTNQDLLPSADALGPNMTIRLNTGEGGEYDLTTLASGHWIGQRARLVLTSNLQDDDLEVFGLVRSQQDESMGNLSTGATGNSCQ
jgi:hypothetical protein